jgi:hypothetical protein
MSAYEVKTWSPELDLSTFYKECANKGYHNNSSEAVMINPLRQERNFQAWILYYNGNPVGSVAAHTLDVFGPSSYRIGVRACILTDKTDHTSVRTLQQIRQHQNHTAQFLIPACIEWAGRSSNLYISTRPQDVASQMQMHRVCMPAFLKQGTVDFVGEIVYRNQKQSFWKLNVNNFYQQLNSYPRW